MGDKITLKGVEVIQGGILQLDFKNEESGKMDRCFVSAQDFFKMLGNSMNNNHIEHMEAEGWERDEKS